MGHNLLICAPAQAAKVTTLDEAKARFWESYAKVRGQDQP
jgi:hypothetical protein